MLYYHNWLKNSTFSGKLAEEFIREDYSKHCRGSWNPLMQKQKRPAILPAGFSASSKRQDFSRNIGPRKSPCYAPAMVYGTCCSSSPFLRELLPGMP